MLTDMIRSALDRAVQMTSELYHAEAAMAQALEALRAGDVDEAEDFLMIGLERLNEFLDWNARGQ